MRTIYHIPILEKFTDALTKANDIGKKIDIFVLTKNEWEELLKCPELNKYKLSKNKYQFYGIPIICEDNYIKNNP